METTIRANAGAGAPGLVLDRLHAAGWTAVPDAFDNTGYRSPDGTLHVLFGPETPAYHQGGPLWTVTHTPNAASQPATCGYCGPGHRARLWTATFGDEVPAEAIAAFLADLTGPEPLDLHRHEVYPASFAEPTND